MANMIQSVWAESCACTLYLFQEYYTGNTCLQTLYYSTFNLSFGFGNKREHLVICLTKRPPPPLCSRPPLPAFADVDKGGLPAATSASASAICFIDWHQSMEQYTLGNTQETLPYAFAICLIDWHQSIKLSSLGYICYGTLSA